MQITVNGEPREIPDDFSAAALVELLGLSGRRLAMEINQEILPRGRFEQHRFQPDDRVEIVQAIGGG
jgi:sulfur carrier protein